MINIRFLYNCNTRNGFFSTMSKKGKLKVSNVKGDPKQPGYNTAISLDKSNNIIIQVLAKPGSKQNAITGITEEGVGIQINAPPTEGEANMELVKYIASVLGVKKNDVVFDKGFKSRSKYLKVMNGTIALEEVKRKIEEEMN